MATRPVTTSDILDGHVSLDMECLDRIYLNGYVPSLQVGGQVVQFLARQGFPIPSPAVVNRIGERFRESVRRFAEGNKIPVVRFCKGDRKIEVMRKYIDRQAATGRSGVAAIGTAQEFQLVATYDNAASRTGCANTRIARGSVISMSSYASSSRLAEVPLAGRPFRAENGAWPSG